MLRRAVFCVSDYAISELIQEKTVFNRLPAKSYISVAIFGHKCGLYAAVIVS